MALGAKTLFEKLFAEFGEQGWWPVTEKSESIPTYKTRSALSAQQKFEVCTGAILTQNTSWGNVEKALQNLKKEKMLSCSALAKAKRKKIANLIRSSGYFNQKAERLQLFCRHIEKQHNGSLKKMFSLPTAELRKELLSLKGIGPETADSIILYAAGKPVFVVDAYTKRLNERLGLSKANDYSSLQGFFESALKKDARLFNEFHALIVRQCKETCRKNPFCGNCVLRAECHYL